MSNPRTAHQSIRRAAGRSTIVVALLVVGAAVAWGAHAYLGMVELQVRVADSCSRVEAMGRSHAELAGNLVRTTRAFDCLEPAQLADIMVAIARTEELPLSTRSIEQAAVYEEFRDAHGRLSAALAGAWSAVKRGSDRESRIVVEDLEARSLRLATLLDDGMQELDSNLEAYRSAAERFPGSFVIAVANLDARPAPRSESRTRRAAAGAPDPSE